MTVHRTTVHPTTQRRLAPMTLSLALGLTAMFGASAASAYSDGQVNLAGKIPVESCLNCHGVNSANDRVQLEYTTDSSCFGFDEDGNAIDLYFAAPGSTIEMKLVVEQPADGESGFGCPTDDCCGDTAPSDDAACMVRPVANCDASNYDSCCYPPITNCADSTAGFNVEAISGAFASEDTGVRFAEEIGEVVANQVTHASAATFADGKVEWSFTYTVPSAADLATDRDAYLQEVADYAEDETTVGEMYTPPESAIPFFVGATIGNGNFVDDANDLNANKIVNIFVSGDEVPAFCMTCANGSDPYRNDDGDVVCDTGGCSNCNLPVRDGFNWPVALGGLFVLGFALRRRRR